VHPSRIVLNIPGNVSNAQVRQKTAGLNRSASCQPKQLSSTDLPGGVLTKRLALAEHILTFLENPARRVRNVFGKLHQITGFGS
jgi:hypothetical protein